MSAPVFVEGLSAFADRYEGFVFDQWGVLHDGFTPYPDVLDVVAELKRRNKRLVMLSNSGRRSELSARRLKGMGFNLADFDGVVTSGEATWRLMADRVQPPFDRLGRRCFFLTHMGDREVLEGLDVETVDRVEDAEFVFASGLEPDVTIEGLRELARAAAARALPLICSNPDIHGVGPHGLTLAPGTFATMYEDQGGSVTYVGKPYAPIYQACLQALAGLELAEIVAIGDSLDHDIKGANGAGIASAFVTGGIHRADFPPGADREASAAGLARLMDAHDARPAWVIPRVVW